MKRKYFGTDGIRDVAGQGLLSDDHVRAYGRALGASLSHSARVLIGRDTRASGLHLRELLSEGLENAGHRVVDGGILSTPAVQTLCREEGFDTAIVISASHNPADDNGIKFFGADGRKLADAVENDLEQKISDALEQKAPKTEAKRQRRSSDPFAGERYLEFLRAECFPKLDLKGVSLVVDCAHGAAAELAPRFLKLLGADLVVRGDAPDGTNINKDAGVFHVAELAPLVQKAGAVMGFALDGDADRVLLVDEQGNVRDGDFMLSILAKDLAKRGELDGKRVITTVMANLGLKMDLRAAGLECEMVPVGDRHVSARMSECGASLGGEQSGHIIFRMGRRWMGDGLYTALRILDIMRREKTTLSRLSSGMKKFPQVLLNVAVRSKPPVSDVPELAQRVSEVEKKLGANGRVVMRYSGTESLLRVMVEGPDADDVQGHAESIASCARAALS